MRIANSNTRIESMKKARLGAQGQDAHIDQVAEDFEAQFIAQMMQSMFSTVEVNKELGGGFAEETYRSLVVDEYGKLMARAGGIGVADQVKREMLKLQEAGGAL